MTSPGGAGLRGWRKAEGGYRAIGGDERKSAVLFARVSAEPCLEAVFEGIPIGVVAESPGGCGQAEAVDPLLVGEGVVADADLVEGEVIARAVARHADAPGAEVVAASEVDRTGRDRLPGGIRDASIRLGAMAANATDKQLGALTVFGRAPGLDKSRKEAAQLTKEAMEALLPFGKKAQRLRQIADYLPKRED